MITTKQIVLKATTLIATTLLAIALISCGGADPNNEKVAEEQSKTPPTRITVQVTPAAEPTSTHEPSANPTSEQSADELILIEMHNNWSEARIDRKYDRFLENCNPQIISSDSRTDAEYEIAWTQALKKTGIAPEEFGASDPSVVVLGGGTSAMIEFTVLRNEKEKFKWANFYTNLNGTWYKDCAVNTPTG